MYKIRVARVEDWEAILPMAKNFYDFYQTDIPFDLESAYRLFLDLIEHGFIVLATKDGAAIGMLGCMVGPYLMNMNFKVATEVMWWVEPEHRRTKAALGLKETAESLAKIDGCAEIVMSALANSPKAVIRSYERSGYAYREGSFVKRV